MTTIPELVFFTQDEYNFFKRGELKIGDAISAGSSNTNQIILTVIGKSDSHYECEDKQGNTYAVDFDMENFFEMRRKLNQFKIAFYRLIIK